MAEEDIQYASVVFRNNKQPQSKAKQEDETVYDEVKVNNKTTQETPKANASGGLLTEKEAKRRHNYALRACCFGALFLVLVLSITGVCVYVALFHKSDENQLNQLKTNQTLLQKENDNLTQAVTVLEIRIANLTVVVRNLTSQSQELQADKKNLSESITNILKTQNELNTSRAHWSVDAYCPKGAQGVRICKACRDGWVQKQSSCYAYNDAQSDNWKTWEGARNDCREKGSDLTAVADENEKGYVNDFSPANNNIKGYWIGLRAVGGEWKWIDGTNLTNQQWVKNQTATDGQCVTSLKGQGWKSVSCEEQNAWICEMKALSV